jgi:hypothetical protein
MIARSPAYHFAIMPTTWAVPSPQGVHTPGESVLTPERCSRRQWCGPATEAAIDELGRRFGIPFRPLRHPPEDIGVQRARLQGGGLNGAIRGSDSIYDPKRDRSATDAIPQWSVRSGGGECRRGQSRPLGEILAVDGPAPGGDAGRRRWRQSAPRTLRAALARGPPGSVKPAPAATR